MATATQFSFTWKDVAVALIKRQGIKEGKWIAGFEVRVAIGLFPSGPAHSPPDDSVTPGAMFLANSVVLTQAQPDSPPSMIVDASEVI